MTKSKADSPPVIAVCGVDFGWGSSGKLSAILQALLLRIEGLRIVFLGTRLGKPILADLPEEVTYERCPVEPERFREIIERHNITAGLVVLDPEVAVSLEQAGCPTVYVDSLPYLWTDHDLIPHNVAVYCAQFCDRVPRTAWNALRSIQRLNWVEGITVPSQGTKVQHRDHGMAVISFGGMHSPLSTSNKDAYGELVLIPTVRALVNAGYTVIEVCGNVDAIDRTAIDNITNGVNVRIAPRTHSEFLNLLDRTEVLVCSPGLTTLFEAGYRNLPTVCLPPQNLSQILNGDMFAAHVDSECRIAWPQEVLDLADVEQARHLGEEAAVSVIYSALKLAEERAADFWPSLQQRISTAIEQIRSVEKWNGLVSLLGSQGATQVAEILTGFVRNDK